MIRKFVAALLLIFITALSADKLEVSETPNQELFKIDSTRTNNLRMVNRSAIEDFESGDFSSYAWTFGGNADWVIAEDSVYQGTYSAKSGFIYDDQTSELVINVNLVSGGLFSFFCKVSSENVTTFHDGLKLYIDDVLRDTWYGEEGWILKAYPVSVGNHTFKWVYEKDGATSNGDDCAWLDYITFPDMGSSQPVFGLAPSSIHYGDVLVNTSSTEQFIISNAGNVTLTGSISTPNGYSVVEVDQFSRNFLENKESNISDDVVNYSISETSNQIFELTFSPTTATTYNDEVVITSNDINNPTNILNVTGTGYSTADITVSPILIEKTLDHGDSTTDILIIGNLGGLTLDYTAVVSFVEPAVSSSNVFEVSETNSKYISSAAKEAPIQYNPANYPTPTRQGGEDVDSAIVILELPYNDTGTTSGYVDDYDEACTWSSTSPDVIYSFTPTKNIINCIVSLCGNTDYDSKLYIYENYVTPGSPLACNDDGCTSALGQSYVSVLTGLSFTTGNTYYFVVDGYGGGNGNYEIDVIGDDSYNWLTLDGVNQVSGTIGSGSPNEEVTVMFNTVPDGLTEGIYQANIAIISNDPDEPLVNVAVTLTVAQQLDPPANVQIENTGSDIELTWNIVTGATSYKVYSSDDPFVGFTEDTTGEFTAESWVAPASTGNKFFQVKAVN